MTRAPGRAQAPRARSSRALPPPAPVPQVDTLRRAVPAESAACAEADGPASSSAETTGRLLRALRPPGSRSSAALTLSIALAQARRSSSWARSGLMEVILVSAAPAPFMPPREMSSARASPRLRCDSRSLAARRPPSASMAPRPPSWTAERDIPTTSVSKGPVRLRAAPMTSPKPEVLPSSASWAASSGSEGSARRRAASRNQVLASAGCRFPDREGLGTRRTRSTSLTSPSGPRP